MNSMIITLDDCSGTDAQVKCSRENQKRKDVKIDILFKISHLP